MATNTKGGSHSHSMYRYYVVQQYYRLYRLTCPRSSVGSRSPRFVATTVGTGFGVTTTWNWRMGCSSPVAFSSLMFMCSLLSALAKA